MPGKNTSGRANTEDYVLGRGKVYIAELAKGATGAGGIAWRDVGNAPEVSMSIQTETLEHQSSRQGLRTTDKQVVLSQELSFSVTLDELNFENLAVFFTGATADHSNAGAIAGVVGAGNLVVTGQGRWYELYATAGGAPTTDPHGDRIYDVGAVTIAGSVEGTDFEVDAQAGMIFVIEGGNLVAGTYSVDVAANAGAQATLDELKVFTKSGTAFAVKFLLENPSNSDERTELVVHQVLLTGEGDLSLISDEYATFALSGIAQLSGNDADSLYATFRNLGILP